MALINFERVMENLGEITGEQVGRCHKIFDTDNQPFYLVENERGDCDMDNHVIEYAVRYTPERGFSCTCASGANGFWNVHHPSGVCKHCRWMVAAVLEERGYMAEMAAKEESHRDEEYGEQPVKPLPRWYNSENESSYHTGTRAHLLITGKLEADDATYTRVMLAHPHPYTEEEIKRDQERYQSRPFKIIDEG